VRLERVAPRLPLARPPLQEEGTDPTRHCEGNGKKPALDVVTRFDEEDDADDEERDPDDKQANRERTYLEPATFDHWRPS
jgi:hypothetical protein